MVGASDGQDQQPPMAIYKHADFVETADMELPSAAVDRSKVLMGPIDLDNSKLTYQDLDALIDTHRIDVTGLTWTQTKSGNGFRLYRLMR